jgi:hypothetical protein
MSWTSQIALKNRTSSGKTTPKPSRSVIAVDTGGGGAADGGSGDGTAAATGAMGAGADAAVVAVSGFGIGHIGKQQPLSLSRWRRPRPVRDATKQPDGLILPAVQAAEGPGSSKSSEGAVSLCDRAGEAPKAPGMTRSMDRRAAGVASLAIASLSRLAASG